MSTPRRIYKSNFGNYSYHFIVLEQLPPDWVTEHLVHRQILRRQMGQSEAEVTRAEDVMRNALFTDKTEI